MAAENRSFRMKLKLAGTALGNLVSVNGVSPEMEFEDTTHHGLEDAWRTFRPTLIDPGEVDFKVQLTTENYAVLLGIFDPDAAASAWVIEFPDASGLDDISFNGWLASWPVEEAEVDGILTVSGKIKITGTITFGEGS